MQKMTSAYANKLLKKLEDDKTFYLNKESEGSTYRAALDETPVVPEYDYEEVSQKLNEINEKVVTIKHAINVSNSTNRITVNGKEMTIDMALIRMAQLNKRRQTLDEMRKHQAKSRVDDMYYRRNTKPVPEYEYINYNLDKVKADYDSIDQEISCIQLSLDKYNQTIEFDVDI